MVRHLEYMYSFDDSHLPLCTGLYIALAVLALNLLRKRRESSSGTMLMIGYTSGMLLLTSAWYVAGATYSARDLIDGARNPARWDTLQCSPAGIAKDVLATLLVFSSDGLMVCFPIPCFPLLIR